MSEISINAVDIIDEVEQKSLLITCTAKLHRYYGVTLNFLDFHQKNFPNIPPLPLSLTPLLLSSPEYVLSNITQFIKTFQIDTLQAFKNTYNTTRIQSDTIIIFSATS